MNAWIVDTFADDTHLGNPAAVVRRHDDFPPQQTMQSIAATLGLPTTAFVAPGEREPYKVRWFTPEAELNLCGHATLASARYLFDIEGIADSRTLRFETRYGALIVHQLDGLLWLRLPRMDAHVCAPPPGLEQALGAPILSCARSVDDIVIEIESEQLVRSLEPDFVSLRSIRCRGHVVTARGTGDIDYVLRSFFPSLGVDEDQVCVSAQCKLGPFWAERLGKEHMKVLQVSPRGGRLALRVTGDDVHVAGLARLRSTQPVEVGTEGRTE